MTDIAGPDQYHGLLAGLHRWAGAFTALGTALVRWSERVHQRHELRALDERALKDIGVRRADAEREAKKPFWRG